MMEDGQLYIIKYLSGLTGFVFDKDVLFRVATDRKVLGVTDANELTQQDKDLLLADLLFVAYNSPNVMAGHTNEHGSFKQSVGSQTINDKKGIYKMMVALYKKWGDEDKLDLISDASSNLSWME